MAKKQHGYTAMDDPTPKRKGTVGSGSKFGGPPMKGSGIAGGKAFAKKKSSKKAAKKR